MSEPGMLVSKESLTRFSDATKFYESRQSSLLQTERQIGTAPPSSKTSLRGWLLQDVWHGEQAMIAVAKSSPQLSSFKIDQFGIWDRVSFPFQIKLRVATRGAGVNASASPLGLPILPLGLPHGSLVWTSAPLVNPSAAVLRQSFNSGTFASTLLPSFGPIQVTCGNPGIDPLLVNSLLPNGTGPVPSLSSPPQVGPPPLSHPYNHGFWLISMSYPIPLDMELIVSGNILAEGRTLSVTKGTDMDSTFRVIATDTLDLDRPLSRGSKVNLTWYSDLGWGIVSAMGKQFIEITSSQ